MFAIAFWIGAAVVTLAVEVVCCAVAYRIHRGAKGLDIGVGELLLRSLYAGCLFAMAGWGGVFLCQQFGAASNGYLLTSVVFIPFGAQVINWVFGLDDWPAGLGIYFLQVIPLLVVGLPLFAFGYVSLATL